MKYASAKQFLQYVSDRNPGQTEFLQAVTEVGESLWPLIEKNPKYKAQRILERDDQPPRGIVPQGDAVRDGDKS